MKKLIVALLTLFSVSTFAQETTATCTSSTINDIIQVWTDGVAEGKKIYEIEADFRQFFSENKKCSSSGYILWAMYWGDTISSRLPRMIYQAAFDTITDFTKEDAITICRPMDNFQFFPNGDQFNYDNKVYTRICHSRYIRSTTTALNSQDLIDLMGLVDPNGANPHMSGLSRIWGDIHYVKGFWRNYEERVNISRPGYVCRLMHGNTSRKYVVRGEEKIRGHFQYSIAGLCAKEYFRSFFDKKREALEAGHYSISPHHGGSICKLTHKQSSQVFLPSSRTNRCIFEFAQKFVRYVRDKDLFIKILIDQYTITETQDELDHMEALPNTTYKWTEENTIELLRSL